MHSANCFFEVLKTTKNYTDQTAQINSVSALLLSGTQPTDSLPACAALFLFSQAIHQALKSMDLIWGLQGKAGNTLIYIRN